VKAVTVELRQVR